MKLATLNKPAVVYGVIRYPVEGDFPVDNKEYARLKDGGFLVEEPDDGLDGMKLDDLKALALEEQIDLGEATKKAEIVAVIRAHRGETPEE